MNCIFFNCYYSVFYRDQSLKSIRIEFNKLEDDQQSCYEWLERVDYVKKGITPFILLI